jgi:Fur family ferric uptake transcriptional regulator
VTEPSTSHHDRDAAPGGAIAAAARRGGEDAAAVLRRAGLRPTPQRLTVLRVLASHGHVTADEVLEESRAATGVIDQSTVYRALEALAAAGLALATDLGAGRMHYELARGHRHHHVVCRRCGAVAHLHDDILIPLALRVATATGFRLSPDGEVVLPGVCPACGAD